MAVKLSIAKCLYDINITLKNILQVQKQVLDNSQMALETSQKQVRLTESALQDQMNHMAENDKFRKSVGLEHLSEQLMRMAGPLSDELSRHREEREEFERKIGKDKDKVNVEDE